MFITAVCGLCLIKLRWSKKNNIYDNVKIKSWILKWKRSTREQEISIVVLQDRWKEIHMGYCPSVRSRWKERGQYPAILTKQAWSIMKGFIIWDKTPKHDKFSLRDKALIPSGQDSSILPARVANPPTQREIRFVYWKVSRGLKCVRASTIEICQSQWVERQQYHFLSVNIQSTSLEVALNKTTESYGD